MGKRSIDPPVIPDLERLIADRQDQLRGRRRDWLDDFADWRRNIDWASVTITSGIIASMLALFALGLSL